MISVSVSLGSIVGSAPLPSVAAASSSAIAVTPRTANDEAAFPDDMAACRLDRLEAALGAVCLCRGDAPVDKERPKLGAGIGIDQDPLDRPQIGQVDAGVQ